jgi:WD40 repeat protein
MSPDNQTLLSNAHDSTVRTWDVRPFAPADRRIQTYDGAPTGQERNLLKASWDPKGEKIAAGSGDQSVAIWETRTGKLLNKLPGHRGAVNDVRFHPLGEPICKLFSFLVVLLNRLVAGKSRNPASCNTLALPLLARTWSLRYYCESRKPMGRASVSLAIEGFVKTFRRSSPPC